MPVFAADSEPTADADLAANADSTTDAESGPEDIPVAVTEDDVATDAELDSLPEPTPAPVLVFDPASESADTTTPEQETMPPATAYQPAAPVPYAPDQYPAPTIIASNKPRKQKKTLFIVLGVILLLVLLVVGGFVGFNIYRSNVYDEALTAFNAQRYQQAYDSLKDLGDYRDAPALMARAQQGIDYEDARVLLDAEDYEGALRAFSALGDYQDAAAMARFCQNTLDFRSAVSDFEAGSYETAREAFSALAAAGFSDAEEWQDKTDYALAELKYDAGDYYGAYKDFEALGSYEDAAERMQQCTTAYPGTGELYHNDAYVSSASSIGIDGTNASYASYYKIYSGSELVSTIFLNAGGECTVDVPPGSYTIKEATGEAWFGEEIMFGDAGHYEVMLFDDGNEYFDLASNIEATITLSVIDGDIGSLPTDREDF
jgi:tetratricopeptide (TPR) repeat protein